MKLQFSFSNQNELIILDDKAYMNPIGELVRSVIDIDWLVVKQCASDSLLDNEVYEEEILRDVKIIIQKKVDHPIVAEIFKRVSNAYELFSAIEKMKETDEIIRYILEALVDEERNSYEEHLLHLMSTDKKISVKSFFEALSDVKILPMIERVNSIYKGDRNFMYVFETTDPTTIVFQELYFMLTNKFYIRKCAHCKRFIWTHKMNQVYCKRPIANTGKTCAQYGPLKFNNDRRTKAYSLYWNRRTKLFRNATDNEKEMKYQQWLMMTEPLREKARQDEITLEEMRNALDCVERKIYNPQSRVESF